MNNIGRSGMRDVIANESLEDLNYQSEDEEI